MRNQKNRPTNDESGKEERIEFLIHALFSEEDLSEEALDALCGWLDDKRNAALKQEALQRYFASRPQPVPGERSVYAEELWPGIARRVAMNPQLDAYRKKPAARKLGMPSWQKIAGRAAAVLIPLLLVGAYIWYDHNRPGISGDPVSGSETAYVAQQAIPVQADSVRHLTLPDGTEVTLNRNSSFSYNDNRECELTGEAYFKVSRDESHPFVIHSGHVKVTVLGTEFNFRASPEEGLSTLALYSGAVQLDHAAGTHRIETAGKAFTLDHATSQVELREFDTVAGPEWLVHETAVQSASQLFTLDDIFDQIEAAYGVTIQNRRIAEPAQRYHFRLDRANSLEAVMEALEYANGKFDYTIQGATIRLEPEQ